ncbi:hypothetical protein [Rheinheimera sp. MM224]|uniref:hypothetical protein n=1 Tax=Rheinheimera sp. MM224 TaxID=3019969 RepID=UPI0021F8688D|nr:hypothetical protein [Rheinheimera sp. MM224]CAI3795767.1 hypothetical protein JAMGFMIE_01400 [Rheinheimera sp. MM224]CAI3795929.1 hypothetical protein JAMGFMIE_01440 [Rheinheimera sp. MM224]
MSEKVKTNPMFDSVNASIRNSWARTIPQNAHGISRTIADLPERINAAIQVALGGPMLTGHRPNHSVMWDLPAYTGFEVALESAFLLSDVLGEVLGLLSETQIDEINVKSFTRRSEYLANKRKLISADPEDFYDEKTFCKLDIHTGTTLKRSVGQCVQFMFDPRTGKLLLVSIPILCTQVAFIQATEAQIEIFQRDRDSLRLNCSYKDAVFAMLLTSLADLKVLLKSDVVDAYFEACSGGADEQV